MNSLTRSAENKWIAGVLGGFAAHYGIDPLVLRLVYGGLAVFTSIVPLLLPWWLFGRLSWLLCLLAVFMLIVPFVLLYLSAVIILPSELASPARDASASTTRQRPGLYKSKRQKVIFGVCGGLAERMEIEVALIRVAFAAATIIGGGALGPVVYIVLALSMRDPDKDY